ncbi:MAG: acyltransferase family protein [Firmicutes bacterium]|nr:acyltransferase family protein [Bacillota bacterium]
MDPAKTSNEKQRIYYLDCLRVIATFAVIMIHVSAMKWHDEPVDSFNWQVLNAYDSLVRFGVPLFVMLSGALFLDRNKAVTYRKLLTRNIPRLMTAFLFWSSCYAAAFTVRPALKAGKQINITNLLKTVLNGHYHMWFVFMIIGLYLVTPFLRQLALDRRLQEQFIIMSFLLTMCTNLLKALPLPYTDFISSYIAKFQVVMVSGYAGYYMLGHYLHNYELSPKKKRLLYGLAAVSLLFTVTASSIWSVKTGTPHKELYEELLPNTFFVSAAVFVWVKDHCTAAKNRVVARFVTRTSELSFGIYLVHVFFVQILKNQDITTVLFNPLLSVPLLSIGVFCASFAAIGLLEKIPFAKRWLM